MRIFIFFFTLFSFELFANQTQYACSEWKLVLPEYASSTYFTETKGLPFVGIEENNKFTLKDKSENTITSNYIGNFNDIIRIFSHIDKYNEVTIFFLRWHKDENFNIIYDKLDIQQVSYNTEYTYQSNCYLN